MNKNQFEERIMKLSGKDKDGDTWIETRNVEAIFRKFLFELEMEVRSSVFVELQSYTDVIPEQQRDELENAITERVKKRIGHNENYCPICEGECKNHGRKNYIYETEE